MADNPPSAIADVIELAKRDISRTQTDFFGRMSACLMDYENLCDEYPNGDIPAEEKAEADEAISGLAGLALAQVALLRDEGDAVVGWSDVRAADVIRAMPLHLFVSIAESITDSDSVVSIYAACEFGELNDDGQQWIAGIVRETLARAGQLIDGVGHKGVSAHG